MTSKICITCLAGFLSTLITRSCGHLFVDYSFKELMHLVHVAFSLQTKDIRLKRSLNMTAYLLASLVCKFGEAR